MVGESGTKVDFFVTRRNVPVVATIPTTVALRAFETMPMA